MTREEAINKLNWALDNNTIEDVQSAYEYIIALNMAIKALEQEPCEDCVSRKLILGDYDVYTNDKLVERIKALGEDMRICQKSITDEKVLIGFNMAVALCNKHLAESEG